MGIALLKGYIEEKMSNNLKYACLSNETAMQMQNDRQECKKNIYACKDEDIIREYPDHDKANVWRPAFVRDVEKIIHNPYYLRYADKTQVFSFVHNDNVSRRAYHVQLVSRIARNIGRGLGLNEDLIEAIALGHDIGHTPFGHAGERHLSKIYESHTGRVFNHNIQSARVFLTIYPVNLSLQTLDGIICHNGELELKEYRPSVCKDFEHLRNRIEETYTDKTAVERLVPTTLEGCVMRVSDIIAYIGKDRQDAETLGVIDKGDVAFSGGAIGTTNSEIINNMIVNILEHSYGKDYLAMDDEYFKAFKAAKKENANIIYMKDSMNRIFDEEIFPMMDKMYEQLLKDYRSGNKNSLIFKHHIEPVLKYNDYETGYYKNRVHYLEEEDNAIVVDFIASMTDDYFVDAYNYMFPNDMKSISYTGYFDNL